MPGDRRRQHQRQLDRGDEQGAGAEASAIAIRYAAGVPKRRISAFATRVVFSVTTSASTAAGTRHPVEQPAQRDLEEDREDRQEEKREGDGGRDRERGAEKASHGSPKPACFSSRRPSVAEQVGDELERGPARFFEPFTTAISYERSAASASAAESRSAATKPRGRRSRRRSLHRPRRTPACRRCPSRPAPG